MVYDSPAAAGRSMVCRKHSPWTMERDRKKTKAHLGSPEPLSEEVEEEEADPDDHDMTEQEAEVLACLGQLNVDTSLANQGDTDSAPLSRASSATEGQRRKLRGSRALSASYHNRLRSCVLNEKGSPLPHSARSCRFLAGGGGQENTAPILLLPVTFGEHAKCWIGRRHSPNNKDAICAHLPQHQATTGVTLNSNFTTHSQVLSTAADHSLLAAAALATSSRHEKHLNCDSPAPKSRSHRRSLSGASVAAAGGLNDSAEALHGPSAEGHAAGLGQPLQAAGWPHARGVSEGSAHRPVAVSKISGATHGNQGSVNGQSNACDSSANGPLEQVRSFPSSSVMSTSAVAALVSEASIAKLGIAAFGVPASVQSCFVDSRSASTHLQDGDTGGLVRAMLSVHELARCAMSCPGDMCNVEAAAGSLGRHIAHCASDGSFANAADAVAVTNASYGSGPILEGGIEPSVDISSDPVISSQARHGISFGASLGPGKALADSAEELELRRLTQQRQGDLDGQEQGAEPQDRLLGFGIAHSRHVDEATAGDGAFSAATSEPLPEARPKILFTPFDVISLARSAGAVCYGASDFISFTASGQCSTCAVHAGLNDKPPSSILAVPQDESIQSVGDNLTCSENGQLGHKPGATFDTSAWQGISPASAAHISPKTQAGPPDAPASALKADEQGGVGDFPDVSALKTHTDSNINPFGEARFQDEGLGSGDGESWLRTSQQAPDPDDPSSAGKYSAVLLRRLQVAAEHEELYGAASGDQSGACGFYHLQGSCGSGHSHGDYGLRGSTGRLHLVSHGSSSMEPSPLPRLSSRMRRLRVSPCLGGAGGSGGGSGGLLASPTPSLLLGTRSRSAGVTPGGVTYRRLRRRSDLLVPDHLGQISARGHPDVDELEDSDGHAGADEHMHDVGHHLFALGSSDGHLRLLAGRSSEKGTHAHRRWGARQQRPASGNGMHSSATPGLRSEPMQRMFSQVGESEMAVRAHSATDQLQFSQHRLNHTAEDFLSGLMDYDDEGAEYTTPPHTPLRGVNGAHDHDATTASGATLVAYKPLGFSAYDERMFAIAPGPGRLGLGKGLLQQRVTFAAHGMASTDSKSASPPTAFEGRKPGREEGEPSYAQMLTSNSLETTQEFNRCLALAATSNDRGGAERLWQEMCSRGVTPDAGTLTLLLRCLSRSAADPDEAQLLAREVCRRGGFSVNATAQRLLEEICFRFEQLNGSTHDA